MSTLSMNVWAWWAFDLFTLIASYFSPQMIAAQTILRSIGLLTFMLPTGIQKSCGTLIGNSVGQGRKDLAKVYFKTTMLLAVVLVMGQVAILGFGRNLVISLFTSQPEIIN